MNLGRGEPSSAPNPHMRGWGLEAPQNETVGKGTEPGIAVPKQAHLRAVTSRNGPVARVAPAGRHFSYSLNIGLEIVIRVAVGVSRRGGQRHRRLSCESGMQLNPALGSP
jgi:hypothetical protein